MGNGLLSTTAIYKFVMTKGLLQMSRRNIGADKTIRYWKYLVQLGSYFWWAFRFGLLFRWVFRLGLGRGRIFESIHLNLLKHHAEAALWRHSAPACFRIKIHMFHFPASSDLLPYP